MAPLAAHVYMPVEDTFDIEGGRQMLVEVFLLESSLEF